MRVSRVWFPALNNLTIPPPPKIKKQANWKQLVFWLQWCRGWWKIWVVCFCLVVVLGATPDSTWGTKQCPGPPQVDLLQGKCFKPCDGTWGPWWSIGGGRYGQHGPRWEQRRLSRGSWTQTPGYIEGPKSDFRGFDFPYGRKPWGAFAGRLDQTKCLLMGRLCAGQQTFIIFRVAGFVQMAPASESAEIDIHGDRPPSHKLYFLSK